MARLSFSKGGAVVDEIEAAVKDDSLPPFAKGETPPPGRVAELRLRACGDHLGRIAAAFLRDADR
ncbi:MAG TPA: hypothetical protein VG389_24965 [Myxococcota bacterium]|nr:hypothetical protein [Myxococcota bacterium]